MAVNGTALVHGSWTNALAVGSTVASTPIATYPDGSHDYAASWGIPGSPVDAVGICGARIAGSVDLFAVTSQGCDG